MMQAAPPPAIRFRALGAIDLKGPDEVDAASILARPKLLALFSYLTTTAPAGLPRRDTLLGLFWTDMDQERARGALRQSLYFLRQFLGEGVVVTRGDDEVGIASDRVWSDVTAFEDALARGAREDALEAYRGDLLEGFYLAGASEFERWLEQRRQDLRRRARTAAWDLAEQARLAGNVTAAAHWARRALTLDPFDEGLLRAVIALLDRLGDRAGAVREYELFAKRLRRELDVDPAPETRALAAGIRARDEVETWGSGVGGGRGARAGQSTPATDAAAAGQPPAEQSSAVRRRRPRQLILIAAAAIVIVLGTVWAVRSRGPEDAAPDPWQVVVAVFENQTGDPALDPLGRMAADWITQGLDQLTVIRVVPSTSGLTARPDFRSQGSAGSGDVRALARATGAGTVVSGRYYVSGDSLGFQAQVVDARTGVLLRAVPPVVGPRSTPGALVDTLRSFVVGAVATVFDSRLDPSPGGRPPSLEAYQVYLEGYRAFHRVPMQMREALTYLYRAAELDTSFLEPRFLIVFAHLNLGDLESADSNAQILARDRTRLSQRQRDVLDWQFALTRGDRMAALQATRAMGSDLDRGVEAVRANHLHEAVEVLRSADRLTESHFQWLALMDAYHMLGEYRDELREAERARAMYPERRAMLDAQVRALAALGRTAEVERLVDEGLMLGGGDGWDQGTTMSLAAGELRAHGDRAAALAFADRAIAWREARPQEDGRTGRRRFDLALANYVGERWSEAQTLFEELAASDTANVNVRGFLGVLAARRGDADSARAISERIRGLPVHGDLGRDVYWQACIASLLGEPERAVDLLREAYVRGRPFSVLLHRDMDLAPLHDYPPFQQFIRSRD
jgi:DNA-binding SARP family transcriptional activator/TolB-like protein